MAPPPASRIRQSHEKPIRATLLATVEGAYRHIEKGGFRLRGTSASRIENFSDVVFGFALTLIVVSSEVPHTYKELHNVLLGFYPFALCFFIFFFIWHGHYRFFRRYGVHDNGTIWINSVLLFTLLLYVYPLKFLFSMVTAGQAQVFTSQSQVRELMILYGAGFAVIYFCLAALHWNAWRQRVALQLSPLEDTFTLVQVWNFFGIASVGVLFCIFALALPLDEVGHAPYFLILIVVWRIVHSFFAAKHIRAARARTSPEDLLPFPHPA